MFFLGFCPRSLHLNIHGLFQVKGDEYVIVNYEQNITEYCSIVIKLLLTNIEYLMHVVCAIKFLSTVFGIEDSV